MSETSKNLGNTVIVTSLADLNTKLAGGTLTNGTQIEFNADSISLFKGTTNPSTNTVAYGTGDVYINTTNGKMFICTNISVASNVYIYTWTEHILVPACPTTDGTYTLSCTVASGVASLSWVSE